MKRNQIIVLTLVLFFVIAAGTAWWKKTILPTPVVSQHEHDDKHVPIQSHRSYHIDTETTSFLPQKPSDFVFTIQDEQHTIIKDFTVSHEKLMHLIIVRKDLQEFQHLHPEYNPKTGTFSQQGLIFPNDGPYRIFADFTPANEQVDADMTPLPVTVSKDLEVGNMSNYTAQPLGNVHYSQTVGNYTLRLIPHTSELTAGQESTLTFILEKSGKPVTDLQPYLGALGHVVVLKSNSLDYIHTHPNNLKQNSDGSISFSLTFPTTGTYKAFGQFQHENRTITGDWVLPPVTTTGTTNEGDSHGHS